MVYINSTDLLINLTLRVGIADRQSTLVKVLAHGVNDSIVHSFYQSFLYGELSGAKLSDDIFTQFHVLGLAKK